MLNIGLLNDILVYSLLCCDGLALTKLGRRRAMTLFNTMLNSYTRANVTPLEPVQPLPYSKRELDALRPTTP